MRRERIRKNRRTLYLTLTGIGAAVIFVAVFLCGSFFAVLKFKDR